MAGGAERVKPELMYLMVESSPVVLCNFESSLVVLCDHHEILEWAADDA